MLHMFFKQSGTSRSSDCPTRGSGKNGVLLGGRIYRRRGIASVFEPSGRFGSTEGYGTDRLFFSLLALALQWFRPRYNAQLQLMAPQIRILRFRIDASRIVPTPKEKAELLRLGASLGHDVSEVMHVVRPDTYRKWVRQSRRGVPFKSSGRPRTPMATVNLVLRMAEENLRWGYRKGVGELKKLGIRVSKTTILIIILRGSAYILGPAKASS
jgi:hypothetical protein